MTTLVPCTFLLQFLPWPISLSYQFACNEQRRTSPPGETADPRPRTTSQKNRNKFRRSCRKTTLPSPSDSPNHAPAAHPDPTRAPRVVRTPTTNLSNLPEGGATEFVWGLLPTPHHIEIRWVVGRVWGWAGSGRYNRKDPQNPHRIFYPQSFFLCLISCWPPVAVCE